jgi:hypothetical protein
MMAALAYARVLVAASATIILLLGFVHLAYTFFSCKLNPRDDGLERDMRQMPLRLTAQTTMWKAWIGFNASHSLGLILFGAIYGYLALCAWSLVRLRFRRQPCLGQPECLGAEPVLSARG